MDERGAAQDEGRRRAVWVPMVLRFVTTNLFPGGSTPDNQVRFARPVCCMGFAHHAAKAVGSPLLMGDNQSAKEGGWGGGGGGRRAVQFDVWVEMLIWQELKRGYAGISSL